MCVRLACMHNALVIVPQSWKCAHSRVYSWQALHIEDIISFDFVSPPSIEALAAALEQLLALGALNHDAELTDDGWLMSKLPLDPAYSKALLVAGDQRCGLPMLSLIAMLSVEGAAFLTSSSDRNASDEARRRFMCPQGDTLTLVNVLAGFGTRKGSAAKAWCEQHHVNRRTVEGARQIRTQLFEVGCRLNVISPQEAATEATEAQTEASRRFEQGLPQLDMEVNRSLRRSLTAAFFLHAAQRQPSGEYLALTSRETVAIHPSSTLFSRRVSCVLFNELLFTTRLYMRDLTQIDAEWLPELAPQSFAQAGPHPNQLSTAGAPRGGYSSEPTQPRVAGMASAQQRTATGWSGGSKLAQIARERELQNLQ